MSEENTIRVNKRTLAAMLATTRYMLTRSGGQATAFAGARQYYDVLGYSQTITIEEYRQRYDRQDIAATIVDLPAVDTWRHPPQISEDGNTETAFVRAWEELTNRRDLGVWGKLTRADRLSGIGEYGILLLGLRGGGELSGEVKEGSLSSPTDVLYLRPFSRETVSILSYEEDTQSPRYGLPTVYEVQLASDEDKTKIHWSRILHLADGKTSSEVFGTPRLAGVWNLLDDMLKFVGGGAEAVWFGMRPGTILRPMEGYRLDMTDDEIEEEVENFVHDPMRFMFLRGIEGQQLGPVEIPDVRAQYEVTLGLISARSRIPQRVLEGSAKGELAASREDTRQWAGEVAGRQKTYAEPEILRPFIDRLVDFGVLPRPANGYNVGQLGDDGEWHWPSIVQVTEDERAEIAQARSAAAKNLSDPLASYPITDGEQRELLGYPAERPVEEIEEELVEEEEEVAAMARLFSASHQPRIVDATCPLCGYHQAESYDGHKGLLRCVSCRRTYDPAVEVWGG